MSELLTEDQKQTILAAICICVLATVAFFASVSGQQSLYRPTQSPLKIEAPKVASTILSGGAEQQRRPTLSIGWPADLTLYKLLTDWGSIIGGVFALIAGAAAYVAGVKQARATRQAAEEQILEDRENKLRQARCIAAAINDELLLFGQRVHAARTFISEEIPKTKGPEEITNDVEALILRARIQVPSVISQNLQHLYLLGDEAGPAAAEAIALTLIYNDLVTRLPEQVRRHEDWNPWECLRGLYAHLGEIDNDLFTVSSAIQSRAVWKLSTTW